MKARFRKYTAVAALIISVLASLLQFHSHDCGGHVRLDYNGHEFVLGCTHDSSGCESSCTYQCSRGAHHSHSNRDCPLHFQSPALFSDHRCPTCAESYLSIAALPADIQLTSPCTDFNKAKVITLVSPLFKARFLYSSPLRGSPACV